MATARLFVYGTLQDPTVQREIIGREVTTMPNSLHGYVKREIELGGTVYPRIESEPGSHINGAVIEVTPDELERIDAYEGADYARIVVTLADDTQAHVYVNPAGANV